MEVARGKVAGLPSLAAGWLAKGEFPGELGFAEGRFDQFDLVDHRCDRLPLTHLVDAVKLVDSGDGQEQSDGTGHQHEVATGQRAQAARAFQFRPDDGQYRSECGDAAARLIMLFHTPPYCRSG